MDKLPPHAPEAEQFVIGCCLTTPVESVPESLARISGGHFYDQRNRIVWEAIISMRPCEVDAITVRQYLKGLKNPEKIGGDQYLATCQDKVTTSVMLPAMLDILVEQKIRRDIIATATQIVSDAYESKDANELLDGAEKTSSKSGQPNPNPSASKTWFMPPSARLNPSF